MLHDCDFIGDTPDVCRLLRLAPDACFFNPLFAPSNLSAPVRTPAVPAVTEFLVTAAMAEEHRRLIGRALVRDWIEDRSAARLGSVFSESSAEGGAGSAGARAASPSSQGFGFGFGGASAASRSASPAGADFELCLLYTSPSPRD